MNNESENLQHSTTAVNTALHTGWEYTVEASYGGYGPVERRFHMSRRRRWVRTRHLIKPPDKQAVEVCFIQAFIP